MSQHPSETEMWNQQDAPKNQKGWFGRNWKWFVPTLILVPLFCCCGVPIGGYFLFQDQMIKMSPYYTEPLQLVEQNTAAGEVLGTPIEAGKPVVSEKIQGGTQYLVIEYPVTGPDGSGVIVAEFDLTNMMSPEMVAAEFIVDSTGDKIDLLYSPEAEDTPDADNETDENDVPAVD